jgi:hypothetical protein
MVVHQRFPTFPPPSLMPRYPSVIHRFKVSTDVGLPFAFRGSSSAASRRVIPDVMVSSVPTWSEYVNRQYQIRCIFSNQFAQT